MAEITVNHCNSEGVKLSVRLNSELVEIAIRCADCICMGGWTNITYADAHKVADWIKENIPESPPAPPEWRIDTHSGWATLVIDGKDALWMNDVGDFSGDEIGSIYWDRITPELHKEMICALLDAHYEMHKKVES